MNEKNYTFDQKHLILAFGGNLIILLLVFILGVKIGKVFFSDTGLPPDKEILDKIKPENISLTFPKSLPVGGKKSDEILPPKNLPIIPTPPPPLPPQEEVKKEEPIPQQEREEVESIPEEKPVKTPKAQKIQTLPENKKITGYTIQIGSFLTPKEAKATVKKYKDLGFDAYTVKISLKDKPTHYRVRIGHYKTKSEGFNAMKPLVTKYGLKPIVLNF